MADAAWSRDYEYRRLRAEYDAAFAELCAAQPPAGQWGRAAEQDRFEKALASYRESRQRLVRFLAGVEQPSPGRRDDVSAVAYRLWEEAGRPIGNPERHWYQAEALVRAARQ